MSLRRMRPALALLLAMVLAATALGGTGEDAGTGAEDAGRHAEAAGAVAAERSGATDLSEMEAQEAERERRVRARTERAKRDAEFIRLDSDGDGYLSRTELAAKEDLKPGPEELDRDNDGKVSRTEFAAVETTSIGPEDPLERGSRR